MSRNIHSAQASMLGYRFQPLYALIVLWKEADDDSNEVSIEAEDDIVLKGNYTRLYQLKHSTGDAHELTIKNDGLWKTLRIWSPYAESDKHKMYFVTGDTITQTNPLYKLVSGDLDRHDIVALLTKEAKFVTEARERAVAINSNKLPFANKYPGCSTFLQLSSNQRLKLLEKITVRIDNFNILQIENKVIDQLDQMVVRKIRPIIAKRLLEWWDRRTLSSSKITKTELLVQLQSLIAQIQDNNLPDDFSKLSPVSISGELGGFMEKQIDLVDGGYSRKKRAAVTRWRARNQREKWITDDILNALELNDYDQLLIETWADRHEPMKEDLEGEEDNLCKKKGLELLDWTHNDAHLYINPIRDEWKQHFLIQGSYQQLSEELKVGWHPNFIEMLGDNQ
ncbi:ABC-three component system protein [Paenibacillus sp. FSL R7-0652]|uniref:ABC-three component system protein n=1 Tax=Paenibacillus sp. FSL R7-0652 TaxID=2921687 RepID=UPI00315ABBC1